MSNITVRPAQSADLAAVARLFDLYRQFYRQPPDPRLAEAFIRARLAQRDSVILVASAADEAPVGFTQLYPTLCSVSAAPIWVLYDLFVAPQARRHGVARALMEAARTHAARTEAVRLELATARDNLRAQALYESLGWVRDREFYRYSLELRG
jgi:ribosomal protein S18 acetylase RimI-like enzyme